MNNSSLDDHSATVLVAITMPLRSVGSLRARSLRSLGVSAERAIGMRLDDLIDVHALNEIRNRMVMLQITRGTERLSVFRSLTTVRRLMC